ncbi:MAG: peptidylprolyl isomerase [Clostridium sp.]|nr:peptidylprolyl isomerase [Clostridium sp.]
MEDKDFEEKELQNNSAEDEQLLNTDDHAVEADEKKAEDSAEKNAQSPDASAEPAYEENDNWQFDAEAPTISNDTLEGKDFAIDAEELKVEPAPAAADNTEKNNSTDKSKIVISKKKLGIVMGSIAAVVVVAVLVVFGVRYFTVPNGKEGKLMNPASVVATVDGTKVSIGMFNYYYSSMVNYYETYAAYGYFDLNTTESYDTQYTTDDDGNKVTWSEFFQNETMEEIKRVAALYSAAIKAGVELTDSQKETIEEQMDSLKENASTNELSLNDFIEQNFGKYCSEDTLRLMLEQYYITANYQGKLTAESKVSQEEIDSYFKEHSTDYYTINFSYLALEYDSTSDETAKKSEEQVKSYLDKITDRDSIVDLVPEVYADYITQDIHSAMESDDTLTEKQAKKDAIATYEQSIDGTISGTDTPFGEEINKWLFSDDTAVGEKNYYIDKDTGYAYIILKTEKAVLDDEEAYSVRHILISPESEDEADSSETEATQNFTDEQWAEAEKAAQAVLDEYNNGDKTEFLFAQLAEKNSADTASTSAGSSGAFGGLYSSITAGQMVPEFENWAMDDSRKYGDTDIVKSDYGYHIMFFISKSPIYQSEIVSQIINDNIEKIVTDSDCKIKQSNVDSAIAAYYESKAEAAEAANAASENTSADASVESAQ